MLTSWVLLPRIAGAYSPRRDAGFAVEAQTLLGPDDNVPGALIFARRQPDPGWPL
jgi:hypothetical protein